LKPETGIMSNMVKGVSIIVCCYNSASRLLETLTHIKQQKTKDIEWEIIVVDNASTDSTSEVAQKILSKGTATKFSVVHEPEPGLSNARRKGFECARFEYLLFCDDDNWLADNYLSLSYEVMESHPEIGILGGNGEAVFEDKEPLWFKKLQSNFAVGDQSSSTESFSVVNEVYGAGIVMRMSFLEKLFNNGFSSILSGRKGAQLMAGEETELCYLAKLLGYQVGYYRGLKFKHLMTRGRMNLDYLKRLHFGFGRTRVYLFAYKYCLENNSLPGGQLKYPYWLDRWIYYFKQYMRNQFALRFATLEDQLVLAGLKGQMHELYQLKGDYLKVFQRVLDFTKKIAH
jgi:glycosyltransferase involved in cell wall biosynthesis